MKAIKVFEPGDIRLVDVEKPEIKKDTQALIKIEAVGICGSDIHILHGTHPFVKYPRIIGHEGSGRVVKVGSAVTNVKPGDNVSIEPITWCGKCYACRKGRHNVCPDIQVVGVHVDGCMAEYLIVEAKQLYKYDDCLTFVEAATAEPYSIGFQANSRAGTADGDYVLVHGAGPIGLILTDVADSLGATVIVSEVREGRLALAKDFGAKYTINPTKEDLKTRLLEITNGLGANIIFEAAGVPKVMEESIDMLSPAGTIINMTFASKPTPINFKPVNKNELTIGGTRLEVNKFSDVLESFPNRKKRIDRLITHVFPITRFKEAFNTLQDQNSGAAKVIITF
jgi:2-desacetyl-2-hydroxyethyl bacteriochlorophyllide A dehydrogenase